MRRCSQAFPTARRKGAVWPWGESVADQILAARYNDNSDAIVLPPVGSGAGARVPAPPAFAAYLLPQWGMVAPFAMPTGAHFRPLGPPALDSTKYAEAYNEVKAFGSAASAVRMAEQSQIALFWAGGGTETPPGHSGALLPSSADGRQERQKSAISLGVMA